MPTWARGRAAERRSRVLKRERGGSRFRPRPTLTEPMSALRTWRRWPRAAGCRQRLAAGRSRGLRSARTSATRSTVRWASTSSSRAPSCNQSCAICAPWAGCSESGGRSSRSASGDRQPSPALRGSVAGTSARCRCSVGSEIAQARISRGRSSAGPAARRPGLPARLALLGEDAARRRLRARSTTAPRATIGTRTWRARLRQDAIQKFYLLQAAECAAPSPPCGVAASLSRPHDRCRSCSGTTRRRRKGASWRPPRWRSKGVAWGSDQPGSSSPRSCSWSCGARPRTLDKRLFSGAGSSSCSAAPSSVSRAASASLVAHHPRRLAAHAHRARAGDRGGVQAALPRRERPVPASCGVRRASPGPRAACP
jgi:hypothetical protein